MKRKIFIVAAVVFSNQLFAQSADTLQGQPLAVVTMTANKIPQKQNTTGKVISVINKEQIEKSNGKTVAQLLNEQAGITIAGAYNNLGSVQSVFMRGAGTGRTLILMDGIPMNDPSQISGDFDINLLSLNDIERIEICRGAQSTLYGSDAIAGVINIITQKNDVLKPLNLKATLAGGNLSTFKSNLQLYGKKDKLSYTARYAKLYTNGFSSAFDSVGNKGFDNDNYNGDVLSGAVQYQATKQLAFKTFVMSSSYTSAIDAAVFVDDRDFTIHNNLLTAGTGFTFKNEIVSLSGNYQYSHTNRRYLNDSGHISGFNKFESNVFYAKTQFAELFASIKLGGGFTLLQGADYRLGSMNNQYRSISSFGPYTSGFKDTSMSQGSMYASLLYNTKKLNVEIGGRLNVHSRYGSNYTYTFNPSYQFTKNWRVFGSIATGFKSPSLYQLYDAFAGNRNLSAETSVNYEGGVQQLHNKVNIRFVIFHRLIENGLDYNYVNFRYFNFVKQTVKGLEYELSYKASSSLHLTVNYTYLTANENTQSRINFKDTSYAYLLRRPAHNINLMASYTINKKIFASIHAKYVSNRNDFGGYKKADVLLNSYWLLNAYGEYRLNNKLKFFADLQNLGNNQFFDIRGFNAIPFLVNMGVTIHL